MVRILMKAFQVLRKLPKVARVVKTAVKVAKASAKVAKASVKAVGAGSVKAAKASVKAVAAGSAKAAKVSVKVAKASVKAAKASVKAVKALKRSRKLKGLLESLKHADKRINNLKDCDELMTLFEEETGLKPNDSAPSSARTKDGKYDLTIRKSSSVGKKTMDVKDVITGIVTRVSCAVVKSHMKRWRCLCLK